MSGKKRAGRGVAVISAAGLVLAGCATQEQTGQLLGGVVGGVVGAAVGNQVGGEGGAIIGGVLGATAGLIVGGEIGAALDERDRLLASQATQDAIYASRAQEGAPVTQEWSSRTNDGVYGASTARLAPDPEVRSERDAPELAPIPSRPPVRGGETAGADNGQAKSIAGAETSASTSRPAVASAGPAPRECYAVQEVAVIPGAGPVRQEVTYCREGDGYVPV